MGNSTAIDTQLTHSYSLNWLQGSVYRLQHAWELTLVDFPVDEAILSAGHRERLQDFAAIYHANGPTSASESVRWVDFPQPVVVGHQEPRTILPDDWTTVQINYLLGQGINISHVGVPTANVDAALRGPASGHNPPFAAHYAARIGTTEPARVLAVEGGASQTGPEDNNVDLSVLRSHAAVNHLLQEENLPSAAFDRVEGLGSLHPTTESEGEELAINRSTRLVLTYAEDVCLLIKPTDLERNLRDRLIHLRQTDAANKEKIEYALCAYMMGIRSFDYLASHTQAILLGTLHDWPAEKVVSVRLPMDAIFVYSGQNDDFAENYPISPSMRFYHAGVLYLELSEAIAEGHLITDILDDWGTILLQIGKQPGLAAQLAVVPVSEDDYREMSYDLFVANFDPFSQMEDHYRRIAPHFYWFDRTSATRAEAICQEVLNCTVHVPWLLMDREE